MLKWSEKREGDAQRDQRKESEKGRLEEPPWQRVACVPMDQPVFVCVCIRVMLLSAAKARVVVWLSRNECMFSEEAPNNS